jgi:hypothetical protein
MGDKALLATFANEFVLSMGKTILVRNQKENPTSA